MKPLILLSLIVFTINSCQSQETNNSIFINYKAQTRGFLYTISLNNNILEINNNGKINSTTLTQTQLKALEKLLETIDFNTIENNISIEDLAVDKAIKGDFNLKFKEREYNFNLNHNQIPEKLNTLVKQLEEFVA